jgi:hypothetical protein
MRAIIACVMLGCSAAAGSARASRHEAGPSTAPAWRKTEPRCAPGCGGGSGSPFAGPLWRLGWRGRPWRPAGDDPGAFSCPGVVGDAGEQPAQFDCG